MCFNGEKIISCQLHFVTLKDKNLNEHVENILELIKASKLEYTISSMSTTIKGESGKILTLIQAIIDYSFEYDQKFLLNTTISNSCGFS